MIYLYSILESAAAYIGLAYVTWLFFLAIMAIKAAKDSGNLPPIALRIAYPAYVVALLLDFLLNLASSVIFWELPQYQIGEWLLTYRCDRHLRDSSGWDKALATWFCRNLLDPFQIGGHCH